MNNNNDWPELQYSGWADTCTTLQLFTQIVGKIRMTLSPWVNHAWHVTLYVTPRGLTTGPICTGACSFQIDFDFINHNLIVLLSDSEKRSFALKPMSVAEFYAQLMQSLAELNITVEIDTLPNEMPNPVPFDQDKIHASYDRDAVERYWRALRQVDRVFRVFRACFTGKCSPVHLFWGSFDLAVTRFSGRAAPPHPGGIPNLPDAVAREAYNRECSSAGFWPGNGGLGYAAFYSYAYPAPVGFAEARVQPDAAVFDATLGEFLLPYDEVRAAADPDAMLLAFLESTYGAAADLAGWDRPLLERAPVRPV